MVRCKCCNSTSQLFGLCDFGKTTDDGDEGLNSNKTGIPIQYYRCPFCGFIFTTQFDDFTSDDFAEAIYNKDYVSIDPDFVEKRPRANARLIRKLFSENRTSMTVLDFGGGSGVLCDELKRSGFAKVETYDPFFTKDSAALPSERFNLVLAFEVVEHVTRPHQTFSDMLSLLDEDNGLIVFSTLVQPDNIEELGTDWWYISPRNGHISIHTQKSLELILQKLGMKYLTANQDIHCAFKTVPHFAKHIIR